YKLLVLTNPEGMMLQAGAPVVEIRSDTVDPWLNNQLELPFTVEQIPAPDLKLSLLPSVSTTVAAPLALQAGGNLNLNLRLNNIGQAPFDGTWKLRAFLSQDDQLDIGDVELKPVDIRSTLLAEGQQDQNAQISFLKRDPNDTTFKTWIPTTTNGVHRLFLMADAGGVDANLENNQLSIDVSLSGSVSRIGFEGWQDERRPQFLTPSLLAQATRADIVLQSDEVLRVGSGYRMASLQAATVTNLAELVDQAPPVKTINQLNPTYSDLTATNLTLFKGTSYAKEQGQVSFVVSELLKSGLQLDPQEFVVVGAGGTAIPVQKVTIEGSRITLDLLRAIDPGENLKLDYRPGEDSGDDLQADAPLWATLSRIETVAGQRKETEVERIASTNLQQVRIEGQTLILNPSQNLLPSSTYELVLPQGFSSDDAGNGSIATSFTINTLASDADATGSQQQAPFNLTLDASHILEGNSGTGVPLISRLSRDGDLTTSRTVRVRLASAGGTTLRLDDFSIEGATYDAASQIWSATFTPGQDKIDLKVKSVGDGVSELDERIVLELVDDNGIQIVEQRRLSEAGTIINDDRSGNDSWATASTLTLGNPVSANNRAASGESNEPQLSGGGNQHTLWWGWTAPANLPAGSRLTLSTQGSSINTRLGLYLATGSSLQEIELNNNGGDDGAARITFQAEAGKTYAIQVDGENGAAGNISLQLFSHRLQLIGTQVIEGLDSTARISMILDRGILDDQAISVSYQLQSETAQLDRDNPLEKKDFSSITPNNGIGELVFNSFQVVATQVNATSGQISLVNHGLKDLERVLITPVGTTTLPSTLQNQKIYYVKVITNDTIELYRNSSILDATNRLNSGQLAMKLHSLERYVDIPIIDDNEIELDESFDLIVKGISSGSTSVLLLNPSGQVTISDLLQLNQSRVLPDTVEKGQLLDLDVPAKLLDPDLSDASYDLTGNKNDNQLIGNNRANILMGLLGNDLLISSSNVNGQTGDTLIGGAGDDIYVLPEALKGRAATEIIEDPNGGTDTIFTGLPLLDLRQSPNVENARVIPGSGAGSSGSIDLIGNDNNNLLIGHEGANSILGGAGNDTLEGGEGTDTLSGGLGDDTYILTDGLLDTIIEASNAGNDTICATTTLRLSLYANIENAVLLDEKKNQVDNTGQPVILIVPTAIDAEGDASANLLQGSSGDNELLGHAGNDTLRGGDGNDTLSGGSGNDNLDGGSGIDTVKFRGNFTDYHIVSLANNQLQVTDSVNGRDGQDIVKEIEHFSFLDRVLSEDTLVGANKLTIRAT
ncbi:MAG: calcium-binding protein, partial [Planctomycetes bacterium]|nr:calcium-binding protein [Planctomycetota bacterium]